LKLTKSPLKRLSLSSHPVRVRGLKRVDRHDAIPAGVRRTPCGCVG